MKNNTCEHCGKEFQSIRKRKLCNQCREYELSEYRRKYYERKRNERLTYQRNYYERKKTERQFYQSKYFIKQRLNAFKYGDRVTDINPDKYFFNVGNAICKECGNRFPYKFEYKPILRNNRIYNFCSTRYNTTSAGEYVCPECGMVEDKGNHAYTMEYYYKHKPRPATTQEIRMILKERERDWKRDLKRLKERRYAKFFEGTNYIDFLEEAETVRKMVNYIKKEKKILTQEEIDTCLRSTFRQFSRPEKE